MANETPSQEFVGPFSPPPGGSGPPQVVDALGTPGSGGPRGGRPILQVAGAVVAVLAILVGVGFVGHQIGNTSSSNQQANQPIPKPAASSGVTAKTGTLNVSAVTAKVEPGVVDITAVDGYQNATSAGTGMILTSNGEVLTNNHVIDGATSITVQVDGVGTKYTAKVVGYDVTSDVALLQLENASGLQTVTVGNSSNVLVGLPVVAIGNALDLPGKPTVTSGAITATGRSITASDQGNSSSENLAGLLQSDASLCSGNSGGPLANSSGQVIGMNTAAATNSSSSSCSTVGFAIPINTALSIATTIQQGQSSTTVHIGLPAFLGVDVENASSAASRGNGFGGFGQSTPPVNSGALITNVIASTPAQSAGLVAGDVITAANGATITTVASLSAAIDSAKPSQSIAITWVDASDTSHTANMTLTTGPAG
ncbi:MAG TPA: trypsin-like peptidase domain-containing protein [Candidatus Acidoferrales bacterium]|nr:trypsin-like peptidase domain-containing protein [Candidatus Acidoferrales bacterium]